MFIGHFALSFAAKRSAPRTSLATTFIAAQLADLFWPIFLLLGWEQVAIAPKGNPFLTLDFTSYPWSHSLATEIGAGVLLGFLYYAATRYTRGALIVGLLVPSHWVLDLIVHVPDLPLYPGGAARFGFGLWRSPAATAVVELALFVAGIIVYARATRARDRIGRFAFWGLVAFLLLIYAGNAFSPPPTNVSALAWTSLIGWPLALWPWWVDRHRAPVQAVEAPAAAIDALSA
ncbi:MAG TPA: hypothetical protein VHB25_21220, partial [Gemmatimonadaceae bacterium]|nr:hypothetical protein [Gemmatimonadaceae bacterium]